MKTLRIAGGGLVLFALIAMVGCSSGFVPDDGSGGPGDGAPQILSFDLSNAQAVGTAQLDAAAANVASRDAQDAFGLVKVLEDGSIEMAMEAPEGVWLPSVQFIAISPVEGAKDLYVSFDHQIYTGGYHDPETDQWVEETIGSFIHVREDGTYVDIVAQTGMGDDGRVMNWGWWGEDDFKPIAFDQAGRIYFVYESWAGGDNVQVLCQYDPATGQATQLTPAISGYHYQSFDVSPDGQYLFVLGQREQSNFFRMYSVDDVEDIKTIFYSSNSNVWVRGFKVSPADDFVVFNGWNVRGTNGIVKASDFEAESLTYDALYDSDTNDWFDPEYRSDEGWDGDRQYQGLFFRGYKWDLFLAVTDGAEVKYAQLDQFSGPDDNTAWTVDETFANGSWTTLGDSSGYYFSTDPTDLTVHAGSAETLDGLGAESPVMVYRHQYYTHGSGSNINEAHLVRSTTAETILGDIGGFDQNYYIWANHWYTDEDVATGVLDAERLLEYLSTYYIQDIDFSYGIETGATAFAAALADEPFTLEDIKGSPQDNFHFLNQHVVQQGTADPAVTFKQFRDENDLGWLNFQDVGNLFFDETGNLWGVLGGDWSDTDPTPIKLLDANGKRDLQVLDVFSDDTFAPVGFVLDGMSMYFRDAVLDIDGFETGRHRMYGMSLSDPDATPVDILANVPDNGSFEIVDFSIGNGFLYFTGVKGISLLGGKVDLTTFEYTPFQDEYRLSNIEVY